MQSTQILKKYFPDFISFLFIFLFVYAAVSKLVDFSSFNAQLAQSPLLTGFTGWIILIIPVIEIMIAILLSINRLRLKGLYASFTIMIMFTVYIIVILNFSEFIPCSCGGVLQHMSWKTHLAFNIVLVLLAALSILRLETYKMRTTKESKLY
ncbi:MAG TPA: MauE/DoxX family redox-associated membrane protein [Puia sp.]|jgi:hypothetical protein|nr:MauE/DoxX family redox-associated membrane protein [Puia sp.]